MTSTAVSEGFVEDGDFKVEILLSEVIVTDNSVVDNDSNVLAIDSGIFVVVLVVVGDVVVVVVVDGFLVLLDRMILCVVPLLEAGRLVVPFLLASVRLHFCCSQNQIIIL